MRKVDQSFVAGERGSLFGVIGAGNHDYRTINRRRQMRGAGIVADKQFRVCQNRSGLTQTGLTGQIDDLFATGFFDNFISQSLIGGTADQNDRELMIFDKSFSQFAVVFRAPAPGFRDRLKRDRSIRLVGGDAESGK